MQFGMKQNVMNNKKIILLSILITSLMQGQDWANLERYKADNKKLGSPKQHEKRVVFMGNSITESWSNFLPEFFQNSSYINRGISGQTTPQMLIRFRSDVIELKPRVVVILAGINDIAENTGPSSVEMISGNIISMAELASSNRIKVIISSILPAKNFPWKPSINPPPIVLAVNELIKSYAIKNNISYVDYYSSMVDNQKGLIKEYGVDSVHPNKVGCEVMASLVEKEIIEVLKSEYK